MFFLGKPLRGALWPLGGALLIAGALAPSFVGAVTPASTQSPPQPPPAAKAGNPYGICCLRTKQAGMTAGCVVPPDAPCRRLIPKGCEIGPRARCAGADLSGLDLRFADLTGADLRGAGWWEPTSKMPISAVHSWSTPS